MTTLANRDYILLIDKSGSMGEQGTHGKTRWEEAQETTLAFARKAAALDPDGITVIPFANTHKVYANTTPDTVARIFVENEPLGGTDTAAALQAAFQLKASDRPITVIVITDGEPNDRLAVKQAIRDFAATLSDNGAGDTDDAAILFLQIGDDAGAAAFPRELDDGLNAKFDIVDTKTFDEIEGMTINEALMAALND